MNDHTTPGRAIQDECETLRDLLPAYSMGITDPEETALVDRLLPDCPDLREELASYEAMAGAMHAAVPQITPPPTLGKAILQQATAEAATTTVAHFSHRAVTIDRRPVLFALAGVAAVLVLALFGVIMSQNAEINRLHDENAALLAQLDTRDDLLALASEDGLTQFTLGPAGDNVRARATVVLSDTVRTGLIRVSGFEQSAPGQAYQAWLIRGDERFSAGVFMVGEDGNATLVFSSPLLPDEIDYMGITPEPAGGSPGPTSDPVVFGAIYAET